MATMFATLIIVAIRLFVIQAIVAEARPTVIIVGAGMSGISAAKRLSDVGIKDILILEATDRIGGRIYKTDFAGVSVEMGANWVEGVNGPQSNPIWEIANKIKITTYFSDYENISSNTYKQVGGLYKKSVAQEAFDVANVVYKTSANLSLSLSAQKEEDISILTSQRLQNHVPSTPIEMAIDYYTYDYECAEPPEVTSLINTVPLPTFTNFGEDIYFVADPRGYESVVHYVANQFFKVNKARKIIDPRVKFNKVVVEIHHSRSGVIVKTADGSVYKADYVMVSVSIGVLHSSLIKFQPDLPQWKIMAMDQFDMSVFTKIFLKFPYKFWPSGNGTEFFIYAHGKRGYYPIWQQLEMEFPGANILMVIVTDDESRRIEQQPDFETKAECMEVLKNMFDNNIPEATEILVPRWWSNKFFKGAFSNWPIGVSQYEYDQLREPVGRIYFTGEHTNELYNGYVHGAYLAGIDTANMLINCIQNKVCKFNGQS